MKRCLYSFVGRTGIVVVLAAWLAAPMARGQLPAIASSTASSAASDALADEYIDGSFGFSIRPPVYAEAIREKRPMSDADVEVVRFQNSEQQWSLAVRYAQTTRPIDTQMAVREITSSLQKDGAVEVLRGEDARIAGRDAIRYAAAFQLKGKPFLRQQAVIRHKLNAYFALVFITPDTRRQERFNLFDRVVDSFKILRSAADEERLKNAVEQGKVLLRDFRTKGETLPVSKEGAYYLRFVMDGREAGFIEVLEKPAERKGRKGVQLRQTGWLFQDNGDFTFMRQDMYLSHDLVVEAWENKVASYLDGNEIAEPVVVQTMDEGMRTDDKLIVANARSTSGTMKRRVIDVERSYASGAWIVLFPRIVDLTSPGIYSFSSYNADRHGLAMRTFEVIGETQVRIGRRTIPAIEIQDSEGLIPPVNKMYVDARGNILKVEAGPLEMIQSERDVLERVYGERIQKAETLLRSHRPTMPKRESQPDIPVTGY